jgi:hypothetical protein
VGAAAGRRQLAPEVKRGAGRECGTHALAKDGGARQHTTGESSRTLARGGDRHPGERARPAPEADDIRHYRVPRDDGNIFAPVSRASLAILAFGPATSTPPASCQVSATRPSLRNRRVEVPPVRGCRHGSFGRPIRRAISATRRGVGWRPGGASGQPSPVDAPGRWHGRRTTKLGASRGACFFFQPVPTSSTSTSVLRAVSLTVFRPSLASLWSSTSPTTRASF